MSNPKLDSHNYERPKFPLPEDQLYNEDEDKEFLEELDQIAEELGTNDNPYVEISLNDENDKKISDTENRDNSSELVKKNDKKLPLINIIKDKKIRKMAGKLAFKILIIGSIGVILGQFFPVTLVIALLFAILIVGSDVGKISREIDQNFAGANSNQIYNIESKSEEKSDKLDQLKIPNLSDLSIKSTSKSIDR